MMPKARYFVDYLLHFLKSNSRHGVHSPFVYRLVDTVIYDFSRKDYQASLKPNRIAALTGRLAAEFQPHTIIELGTGLGLSTLYMARATPASRLITLECRPQTALRAKEIFKTMNVQVDLRTGQYDDILPELLEEIHEVDFMRIDGNLTREATLRYFHLAVKRSHAGTVLLFNSIYCGEEMKDAWQTIKKHPEVRVTIDLFHFGLVFFKRDQEKEDFLIRFR